MAMHRALTPVNQVRFLVPSPQQSGVVQQAGHLALNQTMRVRLPPPGPRGAQRRAAGVVPWQPNSRSWSRVLAPPGPPGGPVARRSSCRLITDWCEFDSHQAHLLETLPTWSRRRSEKPQMKVRFPPSPLPCTPTGRRPGFDPDGAGSSPAGGTPGCSAARKHACLGRRRSQVQILPSRLLTSSSAARAPGC